MIKMPKIKHNRRRKKPRNNLDTNLLSGFESLWRALFESPIHLDSALSKLDPALKVKLAPVVPRILSRPSSLASAAKIQLPPGEPWNLNRESLAQWPAAEALFRYLLEDLEQSSLEGGTPEDFPSWMRDEWKKSWGDARVKKLARLLSFPPSISLRVSQKPGREALRESLLEEFQLKAEELTLGQLSPLALRLKNYIPVLKSDAFRSGQFEIQDEGSQVMALFSVWPELFSSLLSPVPGDSIKDFGSLSLEVPELKFSGRAPVWIDACAGAGGKSLAWSDLLGGRGRVYSYDVSARKLQALMRRYSRLGWNNLQTVTVEEGNELQKLQKFQGTADLVLVDAPCSGWGVLRRNPDIKWRQTLEDLDRLPRLQERLLAAYSKLVRPGGRLIYGVCTFRKSETEEIVENFAESHTEFERIAGGYLGPGTTDGFYMTAFQRKSS